MCKFYTSLVCPKCDGKTHRLVFENSADEIPQIDPIYYVCPEENDVASFSNPDFRQGWSNSKIEGIVYIPCFAKIPQIKN